MNRCPITYDDCGEERYSPKGIRKLGPSLSQLNDFPYTAAKQRQEAVLRAGKISIQGIQPKLSARFSAARACFEIVDKNGRYILKPQHEIYPELPENEDVTMRLAELAGIETPLHGMIYCEDGSRTYFIKRFDRSGRNNKLAMEDFAQLSGQNRETKYKSSLEQVSALLNFCTFPAVAKAELFKRCLFNYLVGNEDMHLKNYSIISRNGIVELCPAYDFLNTTAAFLALGKSLDDIEETALPLKGKKKGLTRSTWIDYFARERLDLNDNVIEECLTMFSNALPEWRKLLAGSFLSDTLKDFYLEILDNKTRTMNV